jgi:hypothetical protein
MGKPVEIKTKQTNDSVDAFLASLPSEQQRKDSKTLITLMKKLSGEKPKLWGSSLVGFGKKLFKSPATGREVEWFYVGFAPRKTSLSLYLNTDVKKQGALLEKLGKHKTGKGCLYVNKLEDVDMKILEQLVKRTLGSI